MGPLYINIIILHMQVQCIEECTEMNRNEDVAVKKIKPPPGVSKDVIIASS